METTFTENKSTLGKVVELLKGGLITFSVILTFILCMFAMQGKAQTIFSNVITDANPSSVNPFVAGQIVASNVTVSGIGYAGVKATSAKDRYTCNTWPASFTAGDYFLFTITPAAGFKINFSSLTWDYQASSTGPASYSFRSSVDNYATDLTTSAISHDGNAHAGPSISLSAFQNITSAITFRIYAWGASGSGGTFSINDFSFTGTVTASCITPTITTSAGAARCGSGTVSLSATPSSGATIDWYAAASGGSPLLSNSTTYSPSVSNSTTTFYAEARNTTAGCVSASRTPVTATVNPLPTVTASIGATVCGSGTVSLSATPSTNASIDWYDAQSGGNKLASGSTYAPAVSSTTTFYAEAKNTTTGCVSANRTALVATVNQPTIGTQQVVGCGAPVVYEGTTYTSSIVLTKHLTNKAGCDSTVTVNIIVNPALNGTLASRTSSCVGGATGTATVNVSGGAAPYSYTWSAGTSTSAIGASLPAGDQICTVTDNVGCIKQIPVTIYLTQVMTVGLTARTSSCVGGSTGSATFAVNGGTAPYSYVWSAGTSTSATGTGLPAGNQSFTVTDAVGCMAFASVSIPSAQVMAAGLTARTSSCVGGSTGSATFAVNGGTAPYSYVWSAGTSTSATGTGLPAGNQSFTVTDAVGCMAFASVSIPSAQVMAAGLTARTSSCVGGSTGSATFAVNGGTAPYSYVWSAGTSTSATGTGLPAGNQTLTVTDAIGCIAVAPVSIPSAQVMAAGLTARTSSCVGGSTGSATFAVSGGTAPYSYVWSAGTSTSATGTGLPAGNQTLTVTDAIGCIAVAPVSIPSAQVMAAGLTARASSCINGASGSATFAVSGGTTPYLYVWSAGTSTSATGTGLPAGNQTLTVTDAIGCMAVASVSIPQNSTSCDPVSERVAFAGTETTDITTTSNQLSIYPNPTNGQFSIEVGQAGTASIYTSTGKEIKTETLSIGKNAINMEEQEAGIYYIKITTADQQEVKKLVKN